MSIKIEVYLSGQDVLKYVDIMSINVTESEKANGDSMTVDFIIVNNVIEKPKPGNVIEIVINGETEFKGVVTDTVDEFVNPVTMIVTCTCSDWTFMLNRKLVAKQEYPEQTCGERIQSMVSEFAPEFGSDYSYVSTGLIAPKEGYDYETIGSILDRMCEATGYNWYVDFDKKIHFFTKETYESPLDDNLLDLDATTEIGGVSIKEDISELSNVIVVKDFQQKSSNKLNETYVADGEQTFFKLQMEPFDVESVEVKVSDDNGINWSDYTVALDPLDGSNDSIVGAEGMAYVCVPGDTLVRTPGGLKRIDEFPTEVLGHDGRYHKVLRHSQRETHEDLISIRRSYCNMPVRMTPTHKVFAIRAENAEKVYHSFYPNGTKHQYNIAIDEKLAEFIPASELKVGDFVAEPIIKSSGNNESIGMDVAELMGFYLAEGCQLACNTLNFGFHINETKEIQRVIDIATDKFGCTCKVYRVGKSNGVALHVSGSRELKELVLQFGRKSGEKHIPNWVFDLPINERIALIKAYWIGDGCKTSTYYKMNSKSIDLINDMVSLLNTVGITSSMDIEIDSPTLNGKTYYNRIRYILRIDGKSAEEFENLMGIGKQSKQRRYALESTITDNYVWYMIKNVERQPQPNPICVYNMEVDECHSYVTHACIVGNCILNWGLRFGTSDMPLEGDYVNIDYDYVMPPTVAVFFDRDSINEMARREGTDGEHYMMVSLPDYRVSDVSTIEFYGQMMLDRHAWPEINGSFETFMPGWSSKQSFYLTSEVRDIYDIKKWVKNGRSVKEPVRVVVKSVTKKIVKSKDGEDVVYTTKVEFSNKTV